MIDWEAVEKERQSLEDSYFNYQIGGFIVSAFAGFYFLTLEDYNFLFFFVVIFYAIYFFSLKSYFYGKWDRLFRERVLSELFQTTFVEFQYNPSDYHSVKEFKESLLFLDYPEPDRYSGRDYVEGKYEGVNFSLSYLRAFYEVVEEDSEGNSTTRLRTIFKGIFMKAEFPKSIEGKVLLYPAGRWIRKYRKVRMDHPEFGSYFKVYATDNFSPYYVFDHSFMEKLIELKKSLNRNIKLSVQGRTLYIALWYDRFFEAPSLFTSVNSVDLSSYERELKSVVELIRYFNLDRRLWTVPSL